jgi:hypothetical protein
MGKGCVGTTPDNEKKNLGEGERRRGGEGRLPSPENKFLRKFWKKSSFGRMCGRLWKL